MQCITRIYKSVDIYINLKFLEMIDYQFLWRTSIIIISQTNIKFNIIHGMPDALYINISHQHHSPLSLWLLFHLESMMKSGSYICLVITSHSKEYSLQNAISLSYSYNTQRKWTTSNISDCYLYYSRHAMH